MGIYGALSTAVTGLRAQSFALENISGNIANSQTTGFKRIDTDFVDLIPDAAQKRQTAGSVLAQSRSTNNVQGDVKGTSTETNMAINGNGFFVVEPAIGQSDGVAVFSGANYYTRRGDFELDKTGYLVNGAGYYLKGLPIDAGDAEHLRLGAAGAADLQRLPAGAADDPRQLRAQPAAAAQDAGIQGSRRPPAANCSMPRDFADPHARHSRRRRPARPPLPAPRHRPSPSAGDTADHLGPAAAYRPRPTRSIRGGGTTMPAIDITDAATDTVDEVLAAIQATSSQLARPARPSASTATAKSPSPPATTPTSSTSPIGTTGSPANGFGLADGDDEPTVSDGDGARCARRHHRGRPTSTISSPSRSRAAPLPSMPATARRPTCRCAGPR